MRSTINVPGLLFIVAMLAYTCHIASCDPFIPLGANPGGAANERTLSTVKTGFVWRAPSLLYIYVAEPNITNPANETAWLTTQKAIFFPPVDKLSKLTIPGTFDKYPRLANEETPSPIIWVSGFGLNSTRKNYFLERGSAIYTVGAYQLVIEMDRGNVTALTWIDGCSECQCKDTGDQSATCPDSACITNSCGINYGDCVGIRPDQCDLKIFVAWVGTDARGRPCTSAGSLPYNFVLFGLSPSYRAAAGVDKQYIFDLPYFGSKKPQA